MELFLVECGPPWLAANESWWVVTEQKSPNEARRFARRWCRRRFPGITSVADDARVLRLSECTPSVSIYQEWKWNQEGTHRSENARITLFRS